MAALDRKKLVKDGKFNRAEIMRRAWAYVKNSCDTRFRNNFKAALHEAWIDAKCVMDDYLMDMQESKPMFNKNVNLGSVLRANSSSIDMRRGTVCW